MSTAISPAPVTPLGVLPASLLDRIAERAADYDRDNRFFSDDFDDLNAAGYLRVAVPAEFGGPGLTLAEVGQLQRQLAKSAPATAVAVNMHLYWTGVAADLWRAGDDSCAWILRAAADGEIFAAGHGEAGNDVPLFMSTSTAERVDGGWLISGHKIFGSLSPAWTYLGVHAMCTEDPAQPRIVHAFVDRSAAGYHIEPTWDALGMRATASHDTILERVFVPDSQVPVVCPAGFAGAGPFQLATFAWGLLGFANVYLGAAQRAFELTVQRIAKRRSIAMANPMTHHPEIQHSIAEMRLNLEAAEAVVDRTTADWSTGAPHGAQWPAKIVMAKHIATTRAFRVVDTAIDIVGGSAVTKRDPLERLFRDIRMGRTHPANSALTHEIVGKAALGIDPDHQPRWG